MKKLGTAFLAVSVGYSLHALIQAGRVLAAFDIRPAATGIGIDHAHPSVVWLRIIVLVLMMVQLAAALYIGRIGFKLRKGGRNGLMLASIIALFLFPFGTAAGVWGLIARRSDSPADHIEAELS